MESNAVANEAFEPDAAVLSPGNRTSMDVDITLCENSLYARSPEPLIVPASPLQHNVSNAQGMSAFLSMSLIH